MAKRKHRRRKELVPEYRSYVNDSRFVNGWNSMTRVNENERQWIIYDIVTRTASKAYLNVPNWSFLFELKKIREDFPPSKAFKDQVNFMLRGGVVLESKEES